MKFEMILYGHKLKPITGVVVNRWNIRALEENLDGLSGDFNDDGPLQRSQSKVFNVSIRESDGHGEIVVYFYDLWAEKCAFIQPGDILHLSGPAAMIHRYRTTDYDHPNCIVFMKEYDGCQLKVESRRIENEDRAIAVTSGNVDEVIIPLMDFSQKKRKRPHSSLANGSQEGRHNGGPQGRVVTVTDSEPGRRTGDPPQQYMYTPLWMVNTYMADGGSRNQLNFYGVVYSYQHPKPCSHKASHRFSASYVIVGPPSPRPVASSSSEHAPDARNTSPYDQVVPVHLVYFANELDQFPAIESVGTIIRLHRVNMQSYQGQPQLVGRQFKSSFVVFKRRIDETLGLPSPPALPHRQHGGIQNPDVPGPPLGDVSDYWEVSSSSPNYSFRGDSELCALFDLHDWGVGLLRHVSYTTPLPVVSSGEDAHQQQIRDYHISFRRQHQQIIDAGPGFGGFTGIDCVGMVLGVLDAESETMPCRLVLWDGTCDGVVRPISVPVTASSRNDPPISNPMGTQLPHEAYIAALSSIRLALAFASPTTSKSTSTSPSHCDMLAALVPAPMSATALPTPLLGGRGVLCFSADAVPQRMAAQQLRPGMWVRARMLASSKLAHLGVESARVLTGSAINVLPPYHLDVINIVRAFEEFTRTHRAVSEGCAAPPLPRLQRRLSSATGARYTPLAVCLASPAPAQFLALVQIQSWHPSSTDKFVVVKATGLPPPSPLSMSSQQQDSTSQVSSSTATASAAGEFQEREGELVYMFALRIHDDTAVTDAVVFGKNGEQLFNGVSAHTFHSDGRIRRDVERHLDRLVSQGIILELSLTTYNSYYHAPPVGSSAQPTATPRAYVKRVAIVNSSLFPVTLSSC